MAASSASNAASKLLNFRNPALQNLIRRHLFNPSAAAAATSFTVYVARNSNLQAHKSEVSFQYWRVGPSATGIEAARTNVPCASKDDVHEDFDDDDDDEDDDDGDVEEYSGSDIDDEDDGEFGDVDEDPATRTRSRRA